MKPFDSKVRVCKVSFCGDRLPAFQVRITVRATCRTCWGCCTYPVTLGVFLRIPTEFQYCDQNCKGKTTKQYNEHTSCNIYEQNISSFIWDKGLVTDTREFNLWGNVEKSTAAVSMYDCWQLEKGLEEFHLPVRFCVLLPWECKDLSCKEHCRSSRGFLLSELIVNRTR